MLAPSEIEATVHEAFFVVATICLVVRLVLSEVQDVVRVVKSLRESPGSKASSASHRRGGQA